MPELAAQLSVEVDLDLGDLFENLAGEVLGVGFGTERFDPAAILAVVEGAPALDLAGLQATVTGALGQAAGQLDIGLPGVTLPESLTRLAARIGSLQGVLPDIEVPDLVGIEALGLRVDAVRGVVETGPLADLLSLVPGLQWSASLGRATGSLGGLLDLLRVLAGLTAMAATSRQLVERTAWFGSLLNRDAAVAAGDVLSGLSSDLALVTAIRNADPSDEMVAAELAGRVQAFVDGVREVGDLWSSGMGYGEAALLGLDITATGAAVEVARLALTGVDLTSVGTLCADIVRAAAPLLEAPLPGPGLFAGGFVAEATSMTTQLAGSVRDWDVAATLAPVTDLEALVLGPVQQFQQSLAAVGSEVTGALAGLRSVVGEIDLTPIVQTVEDILDPVIGVLDAIESEVAGAQQTLDAVARNIVTGLETVGGQIETASVTVHGGLSTVQGVLDSLNLQALGEALTEALRSVASLLGSAQLSPYFDTAIDVITTAADIIEQVPFGMLPTDVQQEIVDACKPIKEIDLQEVEDALREELATIRGQFRSAEVLEGIEQAFRNVVDFIADLDPAPHLQAFEDTTFGELRVALDAVDPLALLAPVEAALDQVQGTLAGLDLPEQVLGPLEGVFSPVLDAIDRLDPATLLGEARAEVDRLRTSITDVLHIEDAIEAITSLRIRAAELVGRVDPHALLEVLDDRVVTALAEMPSGPPAGAFGSILVSVAEASGFRADEPAVQDVIDWVRGTSVGGEVTRGRFQLAAANLAAVRETVAFLDPAPLAAAASAQHRSLRAAVAAHPEGSALRTSLEPLLAGSGPDAVLAPLVENRRRYQIALDADALLLSTLAASGRSEVTESAGLLRAAILPLGAFPARLRALLAALGLQADGRPLRAVLTDILARGLDSPLPAALAELVDEGKAKVLEVVDLMLQSGLDALAAADGILDLIDLGPVVDELTALHTQVRDEVAQLTPEALLGDTIAAADQLVTRLESFDPLQPVREVIDAARDAADAVFESARPTVVFEPVVALHGQVVQIARGLDVVALLRPVLDALDGIAGQLDEGFDRTGDALEELQDALPSEVVSNSISASVDVGVSF